jgi:hypothetical protein
VSGNGGVTDPSVGDLPFGGISVTGADLAVSHSTITANYGFEGFAGGITSRSGYLCIFPPCYPPPLPVVSISNTLIAGNSEGNCYGGIGSGGFNLDDDGTCCNLTDPTDLPSTDPMLGPLQDNGGPTFTHALLPGSPAIDAIPLADCTYDDDGDPLTPEVPMTEDQRGVARPQGEGCDIGAYEVTACADGLDNDGDGLVDYPEDPGCRDVTSVREDPKCQDGINNDPGQDDLIDFDGGLSALGYAATEPDPQCVGKPWQNREKTGPNVCGLGAELALLLPPLMWLLWRRRRA